MAFSEFLKSRHDSCVELIKILKEKFSYVSILGTHVTGKSVSVNTKKVYVGNASQTECGFVVRLYDGNHYAEYSCNDIVDPPSLAEKIITSIAINNQLKKSVVDSKVLDDEPLKQSFSRPQKGPTYTIPEIVNKLTIAKNQMMEYDSRIVMAAAMYQHIDISKMFISTNRDLDQFYTWSNLMAVALARNEKGMKQNYVFDGFNNDEELFNRFENKIEECPEVAIELLDAKSVKPGMYDVITDPEVSGLIAHEAFGHGVEMDMFVKDRAKAKYYINKRVASDLVNMHDGAKAIESVASYFFDDDGVLAHDTLIIKNGILQTGICDAISAMQLKVTPTGNGRRESYSRKAYTRMTNTFFEGGKDKLPDMIKSIKKGYMLCGASNGMEDPKNWGIQCVCMYGKEIINGKFTGKIVSPVCMSGFVPDLLKSISMVSKEINVIGSGTCGKGYKEWVRVSDGGPYLKARVKLG